MVFLLLAACLSALAQSEPYSILPDDPLKAFALSGAPADHKQVAAVEGQPFSQAMRLRTSVEPPDGVQYNVRVRAATTRPARKGDTVVATFWMRCLESATGVGATRFVVEEVVSPWTKSANYAAAAGAGWRRFVLPFTMADSFEAGQYNVQFWMGFEPQVIEIGGVSVANYGPAPVADLPVDRRYDGWQPEAPWRAAAAERIERIRKADLKVIVQDAGGQATPGAEVHVRMKRHAFGFGSAVAAAELLGTSQNSERYRQAILELFNQVVLENDLKWPNWEANRQRALDALKWLHEHGITQIRGHNLVWPSWRNMPADVQSLSTDPEALRRRILDHIVDVVGATRGQLAEWDVINEPYTNRDAQKILGDEEMAAWFKKAREIDPGVLLYINDYAILAAGGNDLAHQNHYFRTIEFLDRLGAPVDGIGMQGHFGADLTPPERLLEILDRFAKLGKAIQVTEFDIDIADEQLQADYTRDFMTTVFSHQSVSGFMMWGFWEGRHWKPRGAMIRRDWSAKPNLEVYKDLVFRQWWTDEKGVAGEDGALTLRGFLGDYEVEARVGCKFATRQARLPAGGATVTVKVGL
ncbi:MAG: endo-1,4-beta-xylanase [Acidobacteriota bacterium]